MSKKSAPPTSSMWPVLVILCFAFACEVERGSATSQHTAALDEREDAPRLTTPTQIGSADAPFLLAPRWIDGQEQLLVSGFRGVGLYLASLDSNEVELIDSDLRLGPVLEIDGAAQRVIALGTNLRARAQTPFVELELDSGLTRWSDSLPAGLRMERLRGGQSDAIMLGRLKGEPLFFEHLRGRLALLTAEGEQIIAEAGAWGVALSPDGQSLAFCLGHLPEAELILVTSEDRRSLGHGAQPSWLPDSSLLLYATPEEGETSLQGHHELAGSELFAYSPRGERSFQLTSTPDITEMQPAAAPRDGLIAFADWRTGTVFTAQLTNSSNDGGEENR